MNTSTHPPLPLRHFPSRVAQLGFSIGLPADWIVHDLPEDAPDFADPGHMVALAAVTAPHAAIVWAAAARPAYGDGSLSDWARYLVARHGLQLRSLVEQALGPLPALVGEAAQDSEVGPLRVRFAFIEDGGRLVNLTLTAPELLADAVTGIWNAGLASFALDDRHGSTVPLWPLAAGTPARTEDEQALDDAEITLVPAQSGAPATESETEPGEDSAGPALAPEGAQEDPAATAPPDLDRFAAHARAEGAATLDPEHEINRRLRDNGVGLVPRVVAIDPAEHCATVACGAVLSQLTLPLGWHVIDDGRRVLVFEPSGEVQVHLDLLACEDDSGAEGLMDALEAQARQDYPAPEFMRLRSGPLSVLGVRHIADGDQPLEQYHLLVDGPDAARMLRARVTATPPMASAAASMAELIVASAVFGSFGGAGAREAEPGPHWWTAALRLERADRLQDAEQCITDAVDHLGSALQVAEMYRLRMLRLQEEGRAGEAVQAREAAVRWAEQYASCATSGGEGAALSAERDAFISAL